jgi:hypothetical protein
VPQKKVNSLDSRRTRPIPCRAASATSVMVSRQRLAPSLRWILVHLVEEYARHNGHADLLRESVDGLVGE